LVGTTPPAKKSTAELAKKIKMPYVTERWLGGTLTNFKQIKSRIDYLNDLKKKRDAGELDKYTKKEKLQIERQIEKMETYFGGLAENLKVLPSAILVVDSKHEKISVSEANQMKIPVVALLNSDCDPTGVKYPVPGNDNSLASVSYFLNEFAKAYKEAGGHKVTGIVPLLDKKFGVEHIREFIGILDETVDVKTWYEADGEIASFGDLCICIGLSPGSLVEICMMKYHAKFLDKKIPLIIFENTFSGKLPEEIKEQLYELTYVQRMDELADVVKKRFLS